LVASATGDTAELTAMFRNSSGVEYSPVTLATTSSMNKTMEITHTES